MQKNNRAFTLIELLVVILIIGILAAVALPQYQLAVTRSRLAAAKPFLAAVKEAEEVYYLEHGQYTAQITALDLNLKNQIASNFAINNYFRINLLGNAAGNNYIDLKYCPGYTHDETQCNTYIDFMYRVWFSNSNQSNGLLCYPVSTLGTSVCNHEKTN